MASPLPEWLRLWCQSALISEIYPEIRAIAVAYSDQHELLMRYYLDREPIDYDFDSIEMVCDEITANTSHADQITHVERECIFSAESLAKIDRLDGLVYPRREYELEE